MTKQAKKAAITIAIFKGDDKIDEVAFQQDSISIGSLPSATIVLEDGGIAEEHAALELSEDGDLIIADGGSEAGTLLNGRKVKRKAFVESGNEIEIGDIRLVVKLQETAETAAAVEPADEPEEDAAAEEPADEPEDEPDAAQVPTEDEDIELELNLIPATTADDRKGERVLEVREILWGDTLFRVDQYHKPAKITFGEAKGTDYFIPSDAMPSDAFPMVRRDGDGLALHLTENMGGYVERKGKQTEITDLLASGDVTASDLSTGSCPVKSFALQTDDLVLVSVGPVSYYMRQVSRGLLIKESLFKVLNYSMLVILLLCFGAIGGLFTAASLTYVEGEERDLFDLDDRFAKVIMQAPEKEEADLPEDKKAPPKKALLRQGKKSVGKEGKVGKKDSKVAMSKGTPRKAINDEEVASSSGILGLLSSSADQDLNAVFGGGGLGGSLDKNLGGLAGPTGVDMRGTGGLGLRGTGTGGGGSGLGIGGIGTWGRGGGRSGYGSGRGRLGGHRRSNITTAAAAAVIKGSLAKSVILSVLKRYYSRIKYCYQKELTRNPNLHGKVKVYFVIGGNGKVKESRAMPNESTLKSSAVLDCVAGVIRQIRFPKPKGGGIVVVKFPFVFRSTE